MESKENNNKNSNLKIKDKGINSSNDNNKIKNNKDSRKSSQNSSNKNSIVNSPSKYSKYSKDDLKSENEQIEGFYSNTNFSELNLHEKTLNALNTKYKFKKASAIQALCIPLAKAGYDILGKAKTGSGKSLAFLIPAVELILKTKFKGIFGIAVIVITPTRELAFQLSIVANDLFLEDRNKVGLLIGGNSRKNEKDMLINTRPPLIIATPGRLLDHMKDSGKYMRVDNLQMLIIDEADTILKIGFEEDLKKILKLLPDKRQTMLFSATLQPKLDDIITMSLNDPQKVEVGETTTVSSLEQGVVILEPENKFRFLYTFIRKNLEKKIMVFFSSCNAVKVRNIVY